MAGFQQTEYVKSGSWKLFKFETQKNKLLIKCDILILFKVILCNWHDPSYFSILIPSSSKNPKCWMYSDKDVP